MFKLGLHKVAMGLLLFLAVLSLGEGCLDDPTQADTLALFNSVWEDFDLVYPYFVQKGIDWDAIRAAHRPNFSQAMPSDTFAARLADMLAELEDLHVRVRQQDGTYLTVYTRDIARNYTTLPRNRYVVDAYQTLGGDTIHHGWVTDTSSDTQYAYIRISDFSTDAFSTISDTDINDLFVTYAEAPGMIIDIRPNNGGNETNAARFASHLTDTPIVYGYTLMRNGPNHDDFGEVQEKTLQPTTGALYDGPVTCLIGETCMSSAEWGALMMSAAGAWLVGDITRGSSGNPKDVTLSNNVLYSVPRWIAYTWYDEDDDGYAEIIEDYGITPDWPVAPGEDSYDESHDYVVEEAISLLDQINGDM